MRRIFPSLTLTMLTLLTALLAGQSINAEDPVVPPADSVNPPVDSSTRFPSHYNARAMDPINRSGSDDFTYPPMTSLRPIPAKICSHDCKAAYVWLMVRIGNFHRVTDCKVVYCSVPQDGFEQTAIDVVKNQEIYCPNGNETCSQWLWHQVIFLGDKSVPRCEESGDPRPEDSVLFDIPPSMTHQERPDYPLAAKHDGVQGTVWVKSLVDSLGTVRIATVGKSSGSGPLDFAAVNSAWKCLYKPARNNGRPVAIWVTYRVDFKLHN
ncbi:MAG: energy transducer TonB [Candidatus Zixiibacteriota bacterium]